MGFKVNLLNNNSPVEKIGKDLVNGVTLSDVLLKKDTSILRPVLTLASDEDIYTYNYLYIPMFGRYYFIDDIRSVHDNLWEISAHVDVLETYKTDILSQQAVISRQQNKYNLYLNDPDFRTYNNDLIQTKKFSASSFTKTLSYVLVVNGS